MLSHNVGPPLRLTTSFKARHTPSRCSGSIFADGPNASADGTQIDYTLNGGTALVLANAGPI